MPIKVACACGAAFAAKDELAGRTVACPKCKQPLKIPAPQAAAAPQRPAATAPHANSALFDDIGLKARDTSVPRCPSCAAELAPNAILCIKCGYNLKLGKKMQTINMAADPAVAGAGGGGGHDGHGGDVTAMIMARAARNADEDIDEEKKKTNEGLPLWILVTAVFACVLFGVVMSLIPQATALMGTGLLLVFASFVLNLFSWIGICIRAFLRNPLIGAGILIGDLLIMGVAIAIYVMFDDETVPYYVRIFALMMIGVCSSGYAYTDESCAKYMFYAQIAYVLRVVGLVLFVIGAIIGAFAKEEAFRGPVLNPRPAVVVVRASDWNEVTVA